MSSEEFGVWKALRRKYHMTFDRDDWRMGRLCQTVANFSGRIDKEHFTKETDFY